MIFENKTRVHFIGIGGVSMSALAIFSLQSGLKVSGSDAHFCSHMAELGKLGATVYEGEKPNFVDKVDIVVYSSAIKPQNSELMRAYSSKKQVYERHEYLGEVAKTFDIVVGIAGTHGKTTVTAIVAHVLKKLEANFVANIGGDAIGLGNYVSNCGEGKKIFVAEACEYKRSLLSLTPEIGVVTNIECDHPDCYATLDSVQEVFSKFLKSSQNKILNLNDFINLSKNGWGIGQQIEAIKTKKESVIFQSDEIDENVKCTDLHLDNCLMQHMRKYEDVLKILPFDNFHTILTNENMYICEAVESCKNMSKEGVLANKKTKNIKIYKIEKSNDTNKQESKAKSDDIDKQETIAKSDDTNKQESKAKSDDIDKQETIAKSDMISKNVEMVKTNKKVKKKSIKNVGDCWIEQVFDIYINGTNKATVHLPLLGDYNRQNAVYAIATVHSLGFPIEDICGAISSFKGVSRRFENAGTCAGTDAVFDFAHHPTEIKCVLEVSKEFGKTLAVFQPHTYTRTAKYIDDFVDVFKHEHELVLMPTYGARELPEDGLDTQGLAAKICDKYPENIVYTPHSAISTIDLVKILAGGYDLILFVGAGDIYDLKKCMTQT